MSIARKAFMHGYLSKSAEYIPDDKMTPEQYKNMANQRRTLYGAIVNYKKTNTPTSNTPTSNTLTSNTPTSNTPTSNTPTSNTPTSNTPVSPVSAQHTNTITQMTEPKRKDDSSPIKTTMNFAHSNTAAYDGVDFSKKYLENSPYVFDPKTNTNFRTEPFVRPEGAAQTVQQNLPKGQDPNKQLFSYKEYLNSRYGKDLSDRYETQARSYQQKNPHLSFGYNIDAINRKMPVSFNSTTNNNWIDGLYHGPRFGYDEYTGKPTRNLIPESIDLMTSNTRAGSLPHEMYHGLALNPVDVNQTIQTNSERLNARQSNEKSFNEAFDRANGDLVWQRPVSETARPVLGTNFNYSHVAENVANNKLPNYNEVTPVLAEIKHLARQLGYETESPEATDKFLRHMSSVSDSTGGFNQFVPSSERKAIIQNEQGYLGNSIFQDPRWRRLIREQLPGIVKTNTQSTGSPV